MNYSEGVPAFTSTGVPIRSILERQGQPVEGSERNFARRDQTRRQTAHTNWAMMEKGAQGIPAFHPSNPKVKGRPCATTHSGQRVRNEVAVTNFECVFNVPPGIRKGKKRKFFQAFTESARKSMQAKTVERKKAYVSVSEIDVTPFVKRAELQDADIGLNSADPFNKTCIHPQLKKFVGDEKLDQKSKVDIRTYKKEMAKQWGVDSIDDVRLFQKANPKNVCFTCGAPDHPQHLCKKRTIAGSENSSKTKFVQELLDFINIEYVAPTRPQMFQKRAKQFWTRPEVKLFEQWVKQQGKIFWD